MKKDNLFRKISQSRSFVFNRMVAEVFDNMASRSIPGYEQQQNFIAEYACVLLQKKPLTILDLGCSTGETLESISIRATQKKIDVSQSNIIATDVSPDMLERCEKKLAKVKSLWNTCTIEKLDVQKVDSFLSSLEERIKNNIQLIILHFVLQFIPIKSRLDVLRSCWDCLDIGGAILIGEKLKSANPEVQKIWEYMQYTHKRGMGYSQSQIAHKQKALEGVLVPQQNFVFETILSSLPHARVELYYAHAEFRCYLVQKSK